MTGGWRERLPIDAIARCDAALVLSGGFCGVPGASGETKFDDFDRALAGYDLYRAGKAPRIILVTSAFHMTRAESLVCTALASWWGLGLFATLSDAQFTLVAAAVWAGLVCAAYVLSLIHISEPTRPY